MHMATPKIGSVPALATVVLVCALVAGCSSSSSQGGGASGGADGDAKVTCNQLTAADVQGLMTATVAGDDVTPVGTDGDGQQCVFHDANSEQAVDVIVVPASDPSFGYDAIKQMTANPVSVPGVGDQAFRASGDFSPFGEHGSVLCTVSTASAVQIPGVSALVVNGSLNLTDAQDGILAAALGTVCNRIFGSGNTKPDLSGL